MALNLPTPGESARLNPMRVPKPVVPKSFTVKPKTPKAPTHQYSPYDQFTQPLPYAPGQIGSLATSGYNTDVANANKLAAMGAPTVDQRNAQTAAQSAAVGSLYQQLAQQIAGIQHVSVDQTNAGTGALGTQNAATAATGNPVASATGTANPGVTGNVGAQAVLASQGAGQGNYLGALQGSALAGGTAAQKNALTQGQSNIANDQLGVQKTLASLLSGVAPISSREGTMTTANTGVTSANIATKLNVYQNLVNQQQTAAAEGDKVGEAAAANNLKKWLAQQSNATKLKVTGANNATKIKTTQTTQAGQTARAKAAAAARVKAAQTAAANKTKTTAAKTPPGGFKNYKITVDIPQPPKVGKDIAGDPTSTPQPDKRVVKTVPANVWNQFAAKPHGQRNLSIIGVPKGSKVRSHTGY